MFINISISPFLIYLYSRLINKTYGIEGINNISFTVLLIAVTNCLKPFISLFSVQRLVSWVRCQL